MTMHLLDSNRIVLIAWASLMMYLSGLQLVAGLSYYSYARPPVFIEPPLVPPPPEPDTPTGNTTGRGGSTTGGELVSPPKIITAGEASPSSTTGHPKPAPLLTDNEPAPIKLRRRLLIVVLVSKNQVEASSQEEADFPLRNAFEGVIKEFGADLGNGRTHAVGKEGKIDFWDPALPVPTTISPFDEEDYKTAIETGVRAVNGLFLEKPHRQHEYDVLFVWYSHIQPDNHPQEVLMPDRDRDQYFLLWAGYAAGEGSVVLGNLFPGDRLWLMEKGRPDKVRGLIRGMPLHQVEDDK